MPKRVDLSPLENGLDYLRSVVDALAGDSTTRDLKYAVLHLAAGIEVLAKYRLHCEHWTLVVSKPDDPKIDRAAFERGDFTSVSGEIALTRLRQLIGLPLTDDDLASVRAAQRQRNKLQHFGLQESSEAIESIAVRALDFVLRFLDDHVVPDADAADGDLLVETMPEIRERLGQIRALVQHRMDKLKPALALTPYSVISCPRCAQTALLLDNPPQCAYCGEQWTDGPAAAEEYASVVLGLNWYDVNREGSPPAEDCPECGATAVVWDNFTGQTDRYYRPTALCFACSESWNDRCGRCGEVPVSAEPDEAVLCTTCMDYLVSHD